MSMATNSGFNESTRMKEIFENLEQIGNWIDQAPDPSEFKNNDDFMVFMIEIMRRCIYILRIGVLLVPCDKTSKKGYTKHRAIIAGHMVRIAKLYEGAALHVAKRQAELAGILFRLLYETSVTMEYIIQSNRKKKVIRSFILTSYRPEKRVISSLNILQKKRKLVKIEKRMSRKIKSRLRRDRISLTKLLSNKNWKTDNKTFYDMLKAVGREEEYGFIYGSLSHLVHGDWYEISQHHLIRKGSYYQTNLHFDDPDPRIAGPVTLVALNSLFTYLKWSKVDPDGVVTFIADMLYSLTLNVDQAHEATMGE